MNYQTTSQTYMRSAVKIGTRQQVRTKGVIDIAGQVALWKAFGKAALVILPLTLVFNIFISSAVSNVERSISLLDNQRQELEDQNIDLLARKARVWAPDHVAQLAGEKLALYSPSKKQVGTFNRRLGTFKYL